MEYQFYSDCLFLNELNDKQLEMSNDHLSVTTEFRTD